MKRQTIAHGLSSREVAFLAEQEPIYILPRYTMNGTELIGFNMPKLRALQRTEVALWLAVLLKKQNKCNIVIPDWLSLPFLKGKFKEEEQRKDRVSELPWHWIPTSKILLDVCQDDFIDSPHELKSLIQDLREIRMLKLRQSFGMIDDEYMEMTGLSLMEINDVRPFLLQTMDTLRNLKKVTIEEDDEEGGIPREEDEHEHKDASQENEIGSPDYSRHEGDYDSNHSITDNLSFGTPFRERHTSHFSDDVNNDSVGAANHSVLNTSALGTDTTLVDNSTTAPRQATKRRRVEHSARGANTGANINDSDSDSDVEYRH